MKIEIFKHTTVWTKVPGTPILLPGSPEAVISYPTYYIIKNLETGKEQRFELDQNGPVDDFCVRADLESGEVSIEGRTQQGFYRKFVRKKNSTTKPRLSFGSHKALNWSQVIDRESMVEMVPLLYAASYGYPTAKEKGPSLLKDLQGETDRLKLFIRVQDVLRAGFEGIFSPTSNAYWGYDNPSTTLKPLQFLGTLAASIQALFIQEEGSTLTLLPKLPLEAPAGRFIDIPTSFGVVHLEWTKKKLRRLFIESNKDAEIHLKLPDGLSRFRLRTSKSDRGRVVAGGAPLSLEKGERYYLDQFES